MMDDVHYFETGEGERPSTAALVEAADKLRAALDAEWPREEIDMDDVLAAEQHLRRLAAASPQEAQPAPASTDVPAVADVLRKLIAWEEKYPPHRIYSHDATLRIADEMTAIVKEAHAALAATRAQPAPEWAEAK